MIQTLKNWWNTTTDKRMDIEILKNWWNTTDKSDEVLIELTSGNKVIGNHKFYVTSGHRALLAATNIKNNEYVKLIDCGDPPTQDDFFNCLRFALNAPITGGKRKSRRNRNSKKSRKKRRKSNRRLR